MCLGMYVAPSRRSVDVAASAVAPGTNTGMCGIGNSSSVQPLWNASCLLLTRYLCEFVNSFVAVMPPYQHVLLCCYAYICVHLLLYILRWGCDTQHCDCQSSLHANGSILIITISNLYITQPLNTYSIAGFCSKPTGCTSFSSLFILNKRCTCF
jgi:hypothetical protein